MSSGAKRVACAPACLGLASGASFGIPAGWLLMQLCLVALLLPLAHGQCRARHAATDLAAFTFAMMVAAHLGFALGTPADVRWLALLPLAALVSAATVSAAAVGALAFSLPLRFEARLIGVLPALWILREWLFSVGDIAIPWARLGYVQAPAGPLAGALPLGGVLLASWSMLLLAGLIALGWHGARRAQWGAAVLMLMMLVAGQFQWTAASGSIDVALVQSGIAADEKADDAAVQRILRFYKESIESAGADLIVTPQLAIPKTVSALPEDYLHHLEDALERNGADALIGMYFDAPAGGGLLNGVLALGASGRQHYIKSQLFPFGEFLPFGGAAREWADSHRSAPMRDTVRPATISDSIVAAGRRLSLAICFEAVFGNAWRRRSDTADLLVNMSSDSAIASRQLARQFRQIDQTRALELQKPLLRTSDVNGSFVVDAAGRMSLEIQADVAAVGQAHVITRSGLTPYARWGDALPIAMALSVLGVVAFVSLGWALPCEERGLVREARRAIPRRQRLAGQVLPAAVGLLLVIAGMFYLMVNSGQSITEKMRVTNAADAAAYSAAVVEARALNYDAYLNRAMVANEIAIAQIISFSSWIKYFATAADAYGSNISEVNQFVLPDQKVAALDVVFLATNYISAYTGTTAKQYAAYVNDNILGLPITALNGLVEVLSASQKVVHVNLAGGIRQQQIANDVVKAMDPALKAEVVLASHGFDVFSKGYNRFGSSGDERGRFAEVTMRSRDEFTRERNWTADSFDIPFVRKDGALKKRGGTELIGYDEWRAVDTLELHGRKFGCGRFGTSWCSDIERPIGWDAAMVSLSGSDDGPGYHGNAYEENATTASEADSAMGTPAYAYFTGIPDSRELRKLDPDDDITTGITVRVHKAQSPTLTSGNALQAESSGDLALFSDYPANGQIAALSRAQVFFDRIAERRDGKTEIGSLYNPYWRVRLVAPTVADKAYAASRQSGLSLPSVTAMNSGTSTSDSTMNSVVDWPR